MEFKSSQTFNNIQNAYNYELQASGKYKIFESKALQEILIGVGTSFNTISRNGLFIAKRLRNIINDGELNTFDNLLEAIRTEEYAELNIYRNYSRIAIEEGFGDIASLFNGIANIKLNHTFLFESLASNLQIGEMFCKPEETLWICLGCGNIMNGLCAPKICPVCGVDQGYYETLALYSNRQVPF